MWVEIRKGYQLKPDDLVSFNPNTGKSYVWMPDAVHSGRERLGE